MRRARFSVPVLMVLLTLSSCGKDDSPSAAERACEARAGVSSAVAVVVDDLRAANFGKAKEGLGGITKAVDELAKAIGELAAAQRQALAPQAEELRTSAAALKNASGLIELQTQVTRVSTQTKSLVDAIGEGLACG